MEHFTDDRYIQRVLTGDREAFAPLVSKYQQMAFILALKLLKQREEAEEATQDAFIKAYQSLATFQSRSSFKTWLFRIVYNTAISRLRSRPENRVNLSEVTMAHSSIDRSEGALEAMEREERMHYLERGLEALSSEERGLLTLYYFDEFSMEEIGQMTTLSEANVKVKIHRARKKLLLILQNLLKNEIIAIQ